MGIEDWESVLLNSQQKESLNLLLDGQIEENKNIGSFGGGNSSMEINLNYKNNSEKLDDFKKDWMRIESKMLHEQDAIYRNHLESFRKCQLNNTKINDHLKALENIYLQLLSEYSTSKGKSASVNKACDDILEEQRILSLQLKSFEEQLYYFDQLELISSFFDSDDFVTNPRFLETLELVDNCLAFLKNHKHYKDAELYQMKYSHILTRGLSLIKVYFSVALSTKDNDNYMLDYSFLKTLTNELEKRVNVDGIECQSLLKDCYNSFFYSRSFLGPRVMENIRLLSNTPDILSYTRGSSSYITKVCSEEYTLFYQLFNSGYDFLKEYLDSIVSYFYEQLLAKIIAENCIDKLVEVIAILSLVGNFTESDDLKETLDELFLPSLQEAQQKLVFRTQTMIKSDIQDFVIKLTDIDYPERLQNAATNLSPLSSSNESLKENLFPTVEKSLYLLSQLYISVNNNIFQELAQEIVSQCLITLKEASRRITHNVSKIDGQLFLVRYLIILREQISPFSGDFKKSEDALDFTHMKGKGGY